MKYDYKSINFISNSIENDNRIKIYDKYKNLKHSIEPKFNYAYIKNNCLYIKIFNENDIILSFENKDEALIAINKLNNLKSSIIKNIKEIYIGNWRISEINNNLRIEKNDNDSWKFAGEFFIED